MHRSRQARHSGVVDDDTTELVGSAHQCQNSASSSPSIPLLEMQSSLREWLSGALIAPRLVCWIALCDVLCVLGGKGVHRTPPRWLTFAQWSASAGPRCVFRPASPGSCRSGMALPAVDSPFASQHWSAARSPPVARARSRPVPSRRAPSLDRQPVLP